MGVIVHYGCDYTDNSVTTAYTVNEQTNCVTVRQYTHL